MCILKHNTILLTNRIPGDITSNLLRRKGEKRIKELTRQKGNIKGICDLC